VTRLTPPQRALLAFIGSEGVLWVQERDGRGARATCRDQQVDMRSLRALIARGLIADPVEGLGVKPGAAYIKVTDAGKAAHGWHP